MGRAPADDCPFDDGAAGVAGLPGAPENLDVHVLGALLALAVDVVLEAGAAVFDTAFEDAAGRGEETLRGGGRDCAGGGIGTDAGLVKGLIDVDVAEAGEAPLIEQDRLDGGSPIGQAGAELLEGEGVVEGFRTEPIDDFGGGCVEPPGAELPQVGPAQVVTVVQLDDRALVLLGRRGARAPDEPAGHPQVDDENAAVVEGEHEVLPAAAHGDDRAAEEVLAQRFERGAGEQVDGARVDVDAGDAAPDDERFEVAADGLDFREFGHESIVDSAGASVDLRLLAVACSLCGVITHLQGNLARMDASGPTIEVDVNGVRYEVLVPIVLWPEIQGIAGESDLAGGGGPAIGLHIFYHATANNPTPVLVGFLRRAEREFFRKFTTVEGIGPAKAAKAMNISVSTIARAIEQEDRAVLSKMPGIGARSADKIIATLRGKLIAEAAMHDGGVAQPVDAAKLENTRSVADAVETISALGYSRGDAKRMVEDALSKDPDLGSVEEITLAVLRRLDTHS